jgi:hypothetical protein
MDLDRCSSATPPGDVPADASVCVVATQQATFQRCQEGIYPCPASYGRTNKRFEYMAFYRTAPVSAVTHYAPVFDRVEQQRGEPGPLNERDWKQLIDPFSKDETVVVFELGDLIVLEKQVENDGNGVRGAWYCSIGALTAADTLSELADH